MPRWCLRDYGVKLKPDILSCNYGFRENYILHSVYFRSLLDLENKSCVIVSLVNMYHESEWCRVLIFSGLKIALQRPCESGSLKAAHLNSLQQNLCIWEVLVWNGFRCKIKNLLYMLLVINLGKKQTWWLVRLWQKVATVVPGKSPWLKSRQFIAPTNFRTDENQSSFCAKCSSWLWPQTPRFLHP